MKVLRSLIHDDVITNKLLELQVKFFEAIVDSDRTSTDFLIKNNQVTYDVSKSEEEKATLIANVDQLKRNQQNRIDNADYYKGKIEFIQNILTLNPNEEIEVNDTLLEFIK